MDIWTSKHRILVICWQQIDWTLKGEAPNKFKAVLLSCKEKNSHEYGDNWTVGKPKEVPMKEFWDFSKLNGLEYDSDK